jgi:hypothetical protein
MRNDYICEVWDTVNPTSNPTQTRHFNGTQAQALKYFKTVRVIKRYLKNPLYNVYVRANSIDLNQVK